MIRLGIYLLSELQELILYVSGHGRGSILGGPIFFKNEYLRKFSVAKMKKTFAIMSQKILYRLCICLQEKYET